MFKPNRLIFEGLDEPEGELSQEIADAKGATKARGPTLEASVRQRQGFDSLNQCGVGYPFPEASWTDEWDDSSYRDSSEVVNGEYTEKGRQKRLYYVGKESLLKDGSTYFYRVKKGDTLEGIKKKFEEYEGFKHLQDLPSDGLISFNIRPPSKLPVGELIPIPSKTEHNEIPSQLFFNYCHEAITEMSAHPLYGRRIQSLVRFMGMKNLLAALYAIACAESGDVAKLGVTAFHRYEGNRKPPAFSYSMFHVLMDGPGKKARRNLNLTVGQTYHPKNAVKLCLAFLCEKFNPVYAQRNGDINLLFDDVGQTQKFITMYVGGVSVGYIKRLTGSYAAAQGFLQETDPSYELYVKPPEFPVVPKEQVKIIQIKDAGGDFLTAIIQASQANAKQIGFKKLLGPKGRASAHARIMEYTRGSLKSDDTVGVGVDEFGAFVLFQRKGADQQFFRLSNPDVPAIYLSEKFLAECG